MNIHETATFMVPISSYKDICMIVHVYPHIIHTDEVTLNFLAREVFQLEMYQGMVTVSFQQWQCNWTALVSHLVRPV